MNWRIICHESGHAIMAVRNGFSFECVEIGVKMWNLETGEEALTLRGHTGPVSSLALSSDGKRLFSGSFDGTIKAWNLEVELAAAR